MSSSSSGFAAKRRSPRGFGTPTFIKIFAVGKDSEAVYFAMDFLPQGLPDRLEVLNRLPDSVLIRIGIDVGSALGFAHREGVVHRDIKVDNILFDEHGNAIVADFGIARAVSNYVQETGTNMVVGTPQYFSPEQARGLPLDGRSDIYSLGVTLYRAATGVLPFVGDDWYDIARQHVEERAVRARKHNPQLGRDLEAVIMRCLEKNPDARYQTGEALCQALAALSFERADTIAMRGTPAPAGPNATPPAQTARPSRWLGIPGVAAIARIPRLDHCPSPSHPTVPGGGNGSSGPGGHSDRCGRDDARGVESGNRRPCAAARALGWAAPHAGARHRFRRSPRSAGCVGASRNRPPCARGQERHRSGKLCPGEALDGSARVRDRASRHETRGRGLHAAGGGQRPRHEGQDAAHGPVDASGRHIHAAHIGAVLRLLPRHRAHCAQ